MDTMKRLVAFISGITLWCFVFVPGTKIMAQESCTPPRIDFEIQLSGVLENAQLIGLSSLGLDEKGRGPVVASAFLQNLEDYEVTNLYLDVKIDADKIGTLISYKANPNNPFSLDPMQTVYVTNNNLADESIPGVEEKLVFNGGLTTEGDNFVENLDGFSVLPSDVYSISVTVYRRTLACGEQILATSTVEIGGGGFIPEEKDIFLRTPGDVVDGNVEITNPFPQFSWEGEAGIRYRLIVVNNNGQDSPESLIESAKSSPPLSEGGSLLQFENLDVYVENNTFQYPSSGAQPLKPGQTYYWQVISSISTGSGTEERSSEIWSFMLVEPESGDAPVVVNEQTRRALIRLIGEGSFNRLREAGFTLLNLEIDGEVISGPQAAIRLAELLQKIEDGDIVVGGN